MSEQKNTTVVDNTTENVTTNTDVQANPGQDHVAEQAIVAAAPTAVVQQPPVATTYITTLLSNMMDDFIAANAGLDVDFVYMGNWLVVDKKGNFIEKDDTSVNYGDHIDVVVGQGEKRWSLWGLQNSPEDGQLIVACREKADAENMLISWLNEHPEAADRYSVDDLELRYMAFVVPVDAVAESVKDPDVIPRVYLMSFAPTATISWGKYAMSVYSGKYKNLGIKARTGVASVVTRLSTKEMKGKDPSVSWLGIEFEAMGMFNPDDYTTNK